MSKRKTITLTLATIFVALSTGAQIYTNYKVDQVLQKFPYLLDNEAILQITESNKNFFRRDLVFSIKNSEDDKAEIISSQLTTLPFFITAESKFSDQFVRKLNKNLNITIDKNTINSQFSPVGDYLQSTILTEFRDFANKPQELAVSLNFVNYKEIELKGNLTGFNYDNDSNLKKLEGKIHLIPVSTHQYDLTNIELFAENADIALLNGENTRLQLKNATYKFNKKDQGGKRDLTTTFSSDILRISNKNRTTEESQTTFGGLNIMLNQKGVPSAVNFYNEFKKLEADTNIKGGTGLLIAILTQNDVFDGKLSVISVNAPKNQKPYFNLQNGKLILQLNNQDLTKAVANFKLNVASVKQTPEEDAQKWEAKEGKLNVQLNDYNLANELAFIPFWLDSLMAKELPIKDNKNFLAQKEKWTKEFNGNSNIEFSLSNLVIAKNKINEISFKNKYESLENDQYEQNIFLTANKIDYTAENMQIENLSISIPLKGNYHKAYLSNTFCTSGYYSQLCGAYLAKETQLRYFENRLKALDFIINNAAVSFNLDTLPKTKAYPVKFEANGILAKAQEEGKLSQNGDFLDRIKGLLTISFNKGLVETSDEKTDKIKEKSSFWRMIQSEIKPYDTVLSPFVEEGENYVAKFEKNDNGIFINGKSLEEIEQELLIEGDSSEEE
ncbi:hypothetical protein BKK49_05715 [Rodentibacter rarus]|uniref:DUF945 domain-containing protein n=1 Tax=Rodentibacter rarus TaxID=1908260 RepID=A0A1V3IMV5_9PAST|nr:hypothetical protein [Rodentibacter rarus]OOF40719.1 hypothetical protein BKK49_05715 [Rodentibacter rarus]OOF43057.1 hypothetical protein BKK50_05535 [Rodentibacter rarus]